MDIYKNRASKAKPLHHGDRLSLNGCTPHPQAVETCETVWPTAPRIQASGPQQNLGSVPATREVPGIA